MKRSKEISSAMPQYDYALALQTAVSWLGDRYLLAQPVTRRAADATPYFVAPRRWHDMPRARPRWHR
jgi:hypothetical protein